MIPRVTVSPLLEQTGGQTKDEWPDLSDQFPKQPRNHEIRTESDAQNVMIL